jgi:hypothetical protein
MTRLLCLRVENPWYALSMRLAVPQSSSGQFGEEENLFLLLGIKS